MARVAESDRPRVLERAGLDGGLSPLNAVWMAARAEIRGSRRRLVLLTLVVAVAGTLVVATVAGARRTSTALERFNKASRSSSVQLFLADPTAAQLERFRRSPDVVALAAAHAYYISFPAAPNVNPAAQVDNALGTAVDRPRVVAGRLANPASVDEIAIGESFAAHLHLRVGDHLDAISYTPAQSTALIGGAPDAGPPAGPNLRFRIVGIVRRPLDLGRKGNVGGVVTLTPAFDKQYAGRIGSFGTALLVRTRHGAADVSRVGAEARRIFGSSPQFSVSGLADQNEGAQNAIDVLAAALWIFAGVAGLAGFVAIAILLSREIAFSGADQETLHALGLTRWQRAAISVPGALLIGGGGAILAGIGAAGASPCFPSVSRASPNPILGSPSTGPCSPQGSPRSCSPS